jgi:hypothetical protein
MGVYEATKKLLGWRLFWLRQGHGSGRSAEAAFHQTRQLVGSTGYRLVQVVCVLGYSHGWAAFVARFDQATHVMRAAFLAILVAQMHFYAGDVFGKTADGILDLSCGPCGHGGVAFDVVIGVDLNLHAYSLGLTCSIAAYAPAESVRWRPLAAYQATALQMQRVHLEEHVF